MAESISGLEILRKKNGVLRKGSGPEEGEGFGDCIGQHFAE